MKVRAAVLEEFGEPLVVQELELAEPAVGEALVRLVACGVCHTDLYTASGADPSGYAPTVLDSLLTILNASAAVKQMLYGAIILALAWLYARTSSSD